MGRLACSFDAGDYLLSVSAFVRPMHLSLFSPTGDPSKPGTGTTLLSHGDAKMHPVDLSVARTSPRRDETVVSPNTLAVLLSIPSSATLLMPGEAESGSAGVQPDKE
jgi:hypothetical protein